MGGARSESYRYIVRSPDVRGNARVEGTRIAVHDVIGLLQNGDSVESITTTCLPMGAVAFGSFDVYVSRRTSTRKRWSRTYDE